MKTLLFLIIFPVTMAFAEEPQNFLTKCYRKDYSEKQKSTKSVTFAVYENLAGETFGTLQVEFKNGNGPTRGIASVTCESDKENLHCTSKEGGSKMSFVKESGVLKFEGPVDLKVQSSYSPGTTSVSRMPANAEVKLETGTPTACEKLVD